MKIVDTKISELIAAEYNPRKLNSTQYEHIKSSLLRFGVVDPVIVNSNSDRKNIIVGGHQRVKVWKDLGNKTIPCFFVDLDIDKEKELNVRLNKNTGEFDFGLLDEFFDKADLMEWGFEEIDFPEIEELEPEETSGDDDIPEKIEPKTVKGDLYELGGHRLLCGDSTLIDDVDKLMDGEKADMVFTDPPYGMNYSGRGKQTSNKIIGDLGDPSELYNILVPCKEVYIWGRVENYKHLATEPRDTIIWKKNNFGMGKGYRGQYECCFYWGEFNGSDSDVWEIPKDYNYVHPTQKPTALCERAIKNSNPSLLVIDLFLGSGSTLIACEKTSRKCYGMELDEKYVDVCVNRYVDFCKKNNREWSVKRNGEDIGAEYA